MKFSLDHGFRSDYSCETQLITTVHDLLGNFHTGSQIDKIMLDFFKAFDTDPHGKLLHKLKLYGVDGNINSWLSDFLTDRKMKVVVDSEELDSVNYRGLWRSARYSSRTATVLVPHQQPSRCSEVSGPPICRRLPPLP